MALTPLRTDVECASSKTKERGAQHTPVYFLSDSDCSKIKVTDFQSRKPNVSCSSIEKQNCRLVSPFLTNYTSL
jgi:hypothetical protein